MALGVPARIGGEWDQMAIIMIGMAVSFNWKRFWCPRGGTINLGDGGYLCDPESESGKYFNPILIGLTENE